MGRKEGEINEISFDGHVQPDPPGFVPKTFSKLRFLSFNRLNA